MATPGPIAFMGAVIAFGVRSTTYPRLCRPLMGSAFCQHEAWGRSVTHPALRALASLAEITATSRRLFYVATGSTAPCFASEPRRNAPSERIDIVDALIDPVEAIQSPFCRRIDKPVTVIGMPSSA